MLELKNNCKGQAVTEYVIVLAFFRVDSFNVDVFALCVFGI